MTRKIAIIFTLSLGISFFILLGILGKQGFFRNLSLKQELEAIRYKNEVINLQVESLKRQESELQSGEGLKDAAFKLGYQSEGEQVYYFSDEGAGQTEGKASPYRSEQKQRTFLGFSVFWIFIIALAFSLLFTVFFVFAANRRKQINDEQ
ncbi:septum formation initiator [Sphaerochaeta pleomorpha str. Grapes]|uniref:Septum formation initiator n=1 Tax=Sphaerochaeta pleomorpha (strain ATCC BAA-1885 / DSM 22778 / Grapes) TaxID=158190 RepID=G8QW67_SPHPG|nr:septum formation initiator family protein [Sphaerochaeta pleomorpha]AEV28310.1 septum formation initiator [Sphaerochaeta pleomorpha str. Grapes]